MSKKDSPITLPPGTKVPNHVVIMPDGDRRWGRARGLSASEGHRAGIKNMMTLAQTCRDWGIHTVSAWGLSTENWLERPKEETDFLFKGLMKALDEKLPEMQRDGVRFVHIGRKDHLPKYFLDKIAEAEKATINNKKHIFNVGLDYNGWDEIVRMTQKIKDAKITSDQIDRKTIDKFMDTAGQPYPYIDLYIRTSGEQRTSGFMMWQADYAEFYFDPTYFPDFSPEKLREAILDFSRRRRRFGGNDAEEHLKFNPKIVADLELKWQRALVTGENGKFRDLVIKYVREHYGLSKDLAKQAGVAMAKAILSGKEENWDEARANLEKLYGLIRDTLKLAFEPEVIARIEVELWKNGSEEGVRHLLAEKFRFSTFQAAKSAHLAYLADVEMGKKNWGKAKEYLEKFYGALKERVA
ncbi:MAG: Isoprenyl transferase [Candidatus Amesbacteria bacterium GW2011_GWA2_42_12]|uniref:Isoprenyl transferase n=1 Tax=Candidatus Amesbacteria bacterium GW2011_GWA2_42_12 TaxID=1618356 RepID=A0A0G1AE40_9BACT|nr:MAG: Isoprenyl transferase [Candidatus Amesbacteria bacterium GW2011_GWA2_42_12]